MTRLRLIAVVLGGLALGSLSALAVLPGGLGRLLPGGAPGQPAGPSLGKALIGGPFSLTDHTGRRVTEKDFLGRYTLVLFGFTFCPDVCPSGLQVMSAALDQLGPRAARVTPILISVDPERDTPAQLATYVQSFHPRLLGLTGTPEELQVVAKAYRVYFKKVKDERAADYTIDHTALIYLMGPDGTYVTHFTPATRSDQMADRLAKLL